MKILKHTTAKAPPTKVSKGYENTLQVYGSDELQDILKENGFVVLARTEVNGEAFFEEVSGRILRVAEKV